MEPVVRPRLVATNDAGATGLGLGEIDRNVPVTESGHLRPDEPIHAGGMRVVAYLAGPPLLRPVHMHVMQVAVAIPEVCQRIGPRILGDIAVMALKAQRVLIRRIRKVKRFRERFYQHPGVIGTVGIVAGDAVSAAHRRMYVLPRRHGTVVAGEAELGTGLQQEFRIVGLMRIMAVETFSSHYRRVSDLVIGERVFVTFEAELDAGLSQHLGIVRLVRVVTGKTIARRNGGMQILLREQLAMARITERGNRRLQHLGLVGLMRVMTLGTLPRGNGRMPVLLGYHGTVTGSAQVSPCLLQQGLVGRVVRVMTRRAFTGGNGWMGMLHIRLRIVATVTEFGTGSLQTHGLLLEGVDLRCVLLVTEQALPFRHRIMNDRATEKSGMTAGTFKFSRMNR